MRNKLFLFACATAMVVTIPVLAGENRQNKAEGPYKPEDAKRILDTPVVRSSKGCVAFLWQNKRGHVMVSYPKDAKGRPLCQSDLAYSVGKSTK